MKLTEFRAAAAKVLLSFSGGFVAIFLLGATSSWSELPLLIAPFGASCVLLFAVPDSPFSQPKNLIGGHLLASLAGLLVVTLAGPGIWQMAAGVALAIAVMQSTNTIHPPAGADPLVIMFSGSASPMFLLHPILMGTIIIFVVSLIFRRLKR